ncbi:hypothetical protein Pcinc_036586 [Petrolisthes cinctipes]|uniref:Uncharacterized protein n=1 Tax=Petrolisthes cinctipes TaxID=88211 RepID=A0AAE1ELT4_PETCI|nr:hypothetical protein Pcinc_036586 [Petrolisthes cinctipes]
MGSSYQSPPSSSSGPPSQVNGVVVPVTTVILLDHAFIFIRLLQQLQRVNPTSAVLTPSTDEECRVIAGFQVQILLWQALSYLILTLHTPLRLQPSVNKRPALFCI